MRTSLEYFNTVRRPHYATHTLRLERVQKQFIWHLTYSSGKAKNKPSCKNRLSHFNMISLQKRRGIVDSVFWFTILRFKIDCPKLLSRKKIYEIPKSPLQQIFPIPASLNCYTAAVMSLMYIHTHLVGSQVLFIRSCKSICVFDLHRI